MPEVAKAAASAGIGWVVINSSVECFSQLRQHSRVPMFSVMSNHEKSGESLGPQIAEILGEQGSVLYLEDPGVGDRGRLRTKGMMATKPQKVTVQTLKGDWTSESGYHAIRSWLALSTARELKVGMIGFQNDDVAVGERRAFQAIADLKEHDEWLKLPIIRCDGVPNAGQSRARQGRLAATIISPPLRGDAIEMLARSRRRGSQPEERTLITAGSFAFIDLQQAAGAGKEA